MSGDMENFACVELDISLLTSPAIISDEQIISDGLSLALACAVGGLGDVAFG